MPRFSTHRFCGRAYFFESIAAKESRAAQLIRRERSVPDNVSDIPVFVLCGGLGTRLREETEVRPKPMVPVGNRPILWHIMRTYSHHGFHRFILCLGYKSEIIKSYFLNYA